MRVEAVEFEGRKHVFNVPVLGKGCVGIVVTAYRSREKVALKIRREDANRPSMLREAQMLREANRVSVGPSLLGASKNFLLMEYVEGVALPEWLQVHDEDGFPRRLSCALRLALEQAWRLDMAGIDHGELSHAPNHVLVRPSDLPVILDFETASVHRKVSNVTSLSQYLLLGSHVAKTVRERLGFNKNKLLESLKNYKKEKNQQNLEEILKNSRIS